MNAFSISRWLWLWGAISLLILSPVSADDGYRLIKSGQETYVLQAGSQSGDGRYALGWTIQTKAGDKPIDWSILESADLGKFQTEYVFDSRDNVTPALINVVLDLKAKKAVGKLAFDDAWFPGRNHGGFGAVWGPESEGRRFGVVINDAKWSPMDVVLIEVGPDGLRQTPILLQLNASVEKVIAAHARKKGHPPVENYTQNYRIENLPEIGTRIGFLKPGVVGLPFTTEIPKGIDDPSYEGIVTLQLGRAKGKPVIESAQAVEAKIEHPLRWGDFLEDPRVAAADRELNAAYTQVRKSLSAAQQETLKQEQRAWLKERDAMVQNIDNDLEADGQGESQRIRRDRAVRDLVVKRTQELRARLKP